MGGTNRCFTVLQIRRSHHHHSPPDPLRSPPHPHPVMLPDPALSLSLPPSARARLPACLWLPARMHMSEINLYTPTRPPTDPPSSFPLPDANEIPEPHTHAATHTHVLSLLLPLPSLPLPRLIDLTNRPT